MKPDPLVIERFHRTLVEELGRDAPGQLDRPFTVAEIYQSLVPYRTHRDRIGVEMNEDYEDALLRLLAGEGDFLVLDSDSARDRIRRELEGPNPNTGLYREFAAVEVRLNPAKLPAGGEAPSGTGAVPTSAEPEGNGSRAGSLFPSQAKENPMAEPTEAPSAVPPGPEAERVLPDTCPDCEKELPRRDSLRFCPFCGSDPFQVECSACGEVMERGWSFCIACGTPAGE